MRLARCPRPRAKLAAMQPLKIAAAVALCAILFWLGLRLTRRAVDLGIAAGRDEARRREAEPDAPKD